MVVSWLLTVGAAVTLIRSGYRARRREILVARASHELRGPLQAVLLGVCASGQDTAGVRGRLSAIERELERAVLALEDLDVARGASGRSRVALDEVDVSALVRAQVRAWTPLAEAQGRALRRVGVDTPLQVVGDGRRLAQATGNLLANALDHGRGEIVVAVSAGEGAVRIEVRDEGPGLRRPLLLTLARGRTSRGEHGHGLVVAHDVARSHGGRLRAAPGAGRLVLELPGGRARAAA